LVIPLAMYPGSILRLVLALNSFLMANYKPQLCYPTKEAPPLWTDSLYCSSKYILYPAGLGAGAGLAPGCDVCSRRLKT
jgi:hypothetical protein